MAAAILIATAGVVIMALKPGTGARRSGRRCWGSPPARCSRLSAIGFRGAILSLGLPSYLMAATFTLVVGLVIQVVAAVGLSVAARRRA